MRDGFGIIIFVGILFIAWLMWSSKEQKEMFLFYGWAAMLIVGIGYPTIKMLLR